MTMPFYVSPQQVMADRAEYARKGISRGRSIVAMEVAEGVLFVAENPMETLHKISEIYDRIAFAGVGRYNEFDALRVAGVRQGDITGLGVSRAAVSAPALAGVLAPTRGPVFTHEMKPMEVEILVAEVGPEDGLDRMYRVTFDGQIFDESGAVTMGGAVESLSGRVQAGYEAGTSAEAALRLAVTALADEAGRAIGGDDLEVALLDREAARRCFRRIEGGALSEMLGAEKVEPSAPGGDEASED